MQALSEVENALSIIELADNRALATDGPVGHVRDEMSDQEWRSLYLSLESARDSLRQLVAGDGIGA